MFSLDISGWSILLRTGIVYAAILAGLILAGKRLRGQMTPFDLVVILLIANAVQNAMVGPDTSVTGGLIAAGVLLAADYGTSRVRERWPWVLPSGTPSILIHNGAFIQDHLRREGLVEDDVLREVREHGLNDEHDVQNAVLETDGTISVFPLGANVMKTRHRIRQLGRH